MNSFSTINYVTSYGEKCSATKNNGIVTIKGDKNGIRQMSLPEFMECFVKDLKKQGKVDLQRSPEKDVVEFAKIN